MRLRSLPALPLRRRPWPGILPCIAAVLAAVAMASVSPFAGAQSATAWSFDQVLQQALQSHPTIAGKRSAQAAARADLDGAQWQRFPSLSAEIPTGSRETGGVVRIDQPLWSGGRIDAGIDAAGSRLDAAGAAIEEERLTLSLRVIAAYTEALRQTARVRSAEEGLAEHQRLLDMIKRRVVQSVSSQTDQRLAESRAYQAANDVSNARQALENALAQLSQLAGKPVRLVSASGIGVGEPLPDASLERVMRQAVSYSPTLQRLDFEAQAADSDITLQRSAYMPKVVLRMEKPTGGINADNRTRAMLVLQAQPGAGLSAKAGVDAAVARREGARGARCGRTRGARTFYPGLERGRGQPPASGQRGRSEHHLDPGVRIVCAPVRDRAQELERCAQRRARSHAGAVHAGRHARAGDCRQPAPGRANRHPGRTHGARFTDARELSATEYLQERAWIPPSNTAC